MLPAGEHVRGAYLGEGGLLAGAPAGLLFIDCSTIDVATSRDVHAAAAAQGLLMLDAPVSGGVAVADAGTLTFMVGYRPRVVSGQSLSVRVYLGGRRLIQIKHSLSTHLLHPSPFLYSYSLRSAYLIFTTPYAS